MTVMSLDAFVTPYKDYPAIATPVERRLYRKVILNSGIYKGLNEEWGLVDS